MRRLYSVILMVLLAAVTLGARQASAQTNAPVVYGRGEIKSFTMLPDGKTLGINTSLGVWLYDANDISAKPKLLSTSAAVYDSAFSADGKVVAVATHNTEVPLLDAETGKVLGTFKEDKEYYSVYAVAITPDGKTLAAGCTDKKIRLFDIDSGDLTTTLEDEHTGYITALKFTPDGKTLISGGDDKLIVIWDVEKESATFTLDNHTGSIHELAISPDGKTLASAAYDKSVRLWDLAKGKQTGELSSTDVSEDYSLAFSPDGKTLAVGTSYPYVVRLWDLSKNKKIADFKGHNGSIYGVAFSPDGKTIISASYDNVLRTWDVEGETEKDVFAGIHSGVVRDFRISPDGKTVAVISYNDTSVRVYAAGKPDVPSMLLEGGDSEVVALAYSSDGKQIAGASSSSIYIWDAAKGKLTTTIKVSGSSLVVIGFSNDNKLIGWGSYDGKAGIYNADTGKSVQAFNGHSARIRDIRFSADGAFFWTSSEDGTVRQWKIGK